MPLADNSFDAVASSLVIHSISGDGDRRRAFGRCIGTCENCVGEKGHTLATVESDSSRPTCGDSNPLCFKHLLHHICLFLARPQRSEGVRRFHSTHNPTSCDELAPLSKLALGANIRIASHGDEEVERLEDDESTVKYTFIDGCVVYGADYRVLV